MARKVLFVCTGNFDRSPTAENMYKTVKGLEVKSAGISVAAKKPLTKKMVEWADVIYVMEELHKRVIATLDPSAKNKVIVLDIPDIYNRDQPELIKLLKQKLDQSLLQPT